MKLAKKIYKKMCLCNDIAVKHSKILGEIYSYLRDKGIDIDTLRYNDDGGYVDMVDYGRGKLSKEHLEELFERYREIK